MKKCLLMNGMQEKKEQKNVQINSEKSDYYNP